MPRTTEPDALKRLEKWLSVKGEYQRWFGAIDPPSGGAFTVRMNTASGPGVTSGTFHGRGETLSAAIHAALDRAEEKRWRYPFGASGSPFDPSAAITAACALGKCVTAGM